MMSGSPRNFPRDQFTMEGHAYSGWPNGPTRAATTRSSIPQAAIAPSIEIPEIMSQFPSGQATLDHQVWSHGADFGQFPASVSPNQGYPAVSSTIPTEATFPASYFDPLPLPRSSTGSRLDIQNHILSDGSEVSFQGPVNIPLYDNEFGNAQEDYWPRDLSSAADQTIFVDQAMPETLEDMMGSPNSSSSENSQARDDPLYNASPGTDGLYRCPWNLPGFRGSKNACAHEPVQLKCQYDKMLDSHLKPFRCSQAECADRCFSSMACRLRHEREAHGMHNHGINPNRCHFPDCDRRNKGFPRRWNLLDHMKRVHDYTIPSGLGKRKSPAQDGTNEVPKKRSRKELEATSAVVEIPPSLSTKVKQETAQETPIVPSGDHNPDFLDLRATAREFGTALKAFESSMRSKCQTSDPNVSRTYQAFIIHVAHELSTFDPNTWKQPD